MCILSYTAFLLSEFAQVKMQDQEKMKRSGGGNKTVCTFLAIQ